jgi:glutathione S-transferase
MEAQQMKLIIARPSPYARKAHIALLEKNIPFEAVIENPWLPGTAVPGANPLGKVPALILDDGKVVHDSKVIVEYLETLDKSPRLIPHDSVARIAHKQIEVLADGVCDAVVLIILERSRAPEMRSQDWMERQRKKIVAGISELSRSLGDHQWFVGEEFGLADVATGCALGYLDFRFPEYSWREAAPNLEKIFSQLSARPSFAKTMPAAQELPVTR